MAGNILVSAQVYHYTPFNYSDPETNPSVILSDKYFSKYALQHVNNFSGSEPFSISKFSLQKKLNRIFSGVGLTLCNTNQAARTYNYAAISYSYRNILFNSAYLRMGFSAKLIQNNVGAGNFDLFTFTPAENLAHQQFSTNFNYNISIASSIERYYLTFSYLNHQPFSSNDTTLFPSYFVIQAGNLASVINKYNLLHVISFVYFTKIGLNGSKEHNYYANLFYALKISRYTTILGGGRVGYSSAEYFHFLPSIAIQKEKVLWTVAYGFYKTNNTSAIFTNSFMTQINFTLPWSQNKYFRGSVHF